MNRRNLFVLGLLLVSLVGNISLLAPRAIALGEDIRLWYQMSNDFRYQLVKYVEAAMPGAYIVSVLVEESEREPVGRGVRVFWTFDKRVTYKLGSEALWQYVYDVYAEIGDYVLATGEYDWVEIGLVLLYETDVLDGKAWKCEAIRSVRGTAAGMQEWVDEGCTDIALQSLASSGQLAVHTISPYAMPYEVHESLRRPFAGPPLWVQLRGWKRPAGE